MSKFYLAIAVTTLAMSALASTADARGSGNFYSSYQYRMQGRQQQQPQYDESAQYEREKAYAIAKARAKELAAARERAAEHARLLALKQKSSKTEAVAETPPPKGDAATQPALKKADLDSSAPATTPSTDTAPPAAQTCRKYSAATGGLVDTPCQ
jgi:hypothetical protein